jgi:ClpP class serine protease
MTKTPRRKIADLSMENIRRAAASSVLVLSHEAIGKSVLLSDAVENEFVKVAVEDAETKPAVVGKKQVGNVAVVRVSGPLAQHAIADMCGYVDGYDAITARFMSALNTDAVAVLLVIDSPGGDAAGIEQATQRMAAAAEKAGKPVVTYVDEMAASGGYWLAAALSDKIVVPPAGQVGSIGCISGFVDETGALEQAGVKVTLIRVPDGKADGHPYAPIADLAMERGLRECSAIADTFFKMVATTRKIAVDKVRGFNADMFRGQVAVDLKLADKVGSLEDALQEAAKLGRASARKKASVMIEEIAAPLMISSEDSETVKKLCGIFGATSNLDLISKAAAAHDAKSAIEISKAEAAKLADEVKALRKQVDDTKAAAMIREAESDCRVRQDNKQSTVAFYEQFGLEGLKTFLAALPPLPSARKVEEPKREPAETLAVLVKAAEADEAKAPTVSEDASKWSRAQKVAYAEKHGWDAYRKLAGRG